MMPEKRSEFRSKPVIFIDKRLYYIVTFLFFTYPLKIYLFGADALSGAFVVILLMLFLFSNLFGMWNHLSRMPLAWRLIGWSSVTIVFFRLLQIYLYSTGEEKKVVSPGDNLWLLGIIRDIADFGNTRDSHAVSGVGYSYHYGALIHLSVLARHHDFFIEFGLIFLMPFMLYLFSSIQILKLTSLIAPNSESQVLAIVFFTFVPATIFAGSLDELIDTVLTEPTFRYSYYLPTHYGFALVLFLTLIVLRSNLISILFLCPILLCSLYSTKPVFLIVAMPLVLFLFIGRLNESPWKVPVRLSFLAILFSQMIAITFILPKTELSSPYFDININLLALMENPLKAQNQTLIAFFSILCFVILQTRKHLVHIQLQASLSIFLVSLITFISTKVIVLTYSKDLHPTVLANIETSSDNSSFLSNDAQALYLLIPLYSLLIPLLVCHKRRSVFYRAISGLVYFCILSVQLGQVSNEIVVYSRDKSFVSEDDFDYGPYVSAISRVPVNNSLILSNDIANPIKEFSRPDSADYLSAFTGHSFYISRLGWQSFSLESWRRIEEVRKFFRTSDLDFIQDFIQQRNVTHIAIHSRCSNFGSNSKDIRAWELLTQEQLLSRIKINGLPINYGVPVYGLARCI